MKNYFKKFSIMFVMSLILMLGCCVSAFADDSYEIGKNNYNNSVNNSAKVGVQLIEPEKGWKRADDTNDKIHYNGPWKSPYTNANEKLYNGSLAYSNDAGSSYVFYFYGTKFRLIDTYNQYMPKSATVKIDDNISETYSSNSTDKVFVLH